MIRVRQANKQVILRSLRKMSISPYGVTDPDGYLYQRRLEAVVRPCGPLLKRYVQGRNLLCVFMYDDDTKTLGVQIGLPEKNNCVIGLSLKALDKGYDFATFILLHEIAHLKVRGHGPDFSAYLDALIQIFNENTGKHIVRPW